jgi:hypothetical protein
MFSRGAKTRRLTPAFMTRAARTTIIRYTQAGKKEAFICLRQMKTPGKAAPEIARCL